MAVNMDTLNINFFATGVVNVHTDSQIVADYGGGDSDQLFGEFDYAAPGLLTGGSLNHIQEYLDYGLQFDINRLDFPVDTFIALLDTGDAQTAFAAIFFGADKFKGSAFGDLLRSYGGNDTVAANGGYDTVFGGDGADTIDGGTGASYLRGDAGDDLILGGPDFDDINGNEGNDILYGRGGNDWVLGGKSDDTLYGESGDDIVYGNLGDDTASGGIGADTIRGGQGNDLIDGDEGDDWLSGDLGSDVLRGGPGADTFHFFAGAGVDRVLDFSAGDRVQLDPNTTYRVEQLGNDTIVRIGATDQLILEGVRLAALPQGWIFLG
ncbi:MAG: calcium-binding protein [Phenylobacterium sp.]